MSDYTKNQKAEEYRKLCCVTGELSGDIKIDINTKLSNDWGVINSNIDGKTHFKGAAFQRGDEIVICFAGTKSLSAKDHGANLKMAIGKESAQMKKAEAYYTEIKSKYSYFKITLAGHSEGGSECIYVGLKYDVETYTFNAFTPGKKLLIAIAQNRNKPVNPSLITNYRDPHDPVSKLLNPDIGKTYIVENPYNNIFAKSPFGLITAHRIKNMGNCLNAVPIEEYKKTHKFFIDKLKNIKITKHNIKKIGDAGLFGVYEYEIEEMIKTRNVNHSNLSNKLLNTSNIVHQR